MKKKVCGFYSFLLAVGIVAFFASCSLLDTSVFTRTPVSGDYTFGNLEQTAGRVTAVTITAKSGKSPGARTIYYQGTDGTIYTKSITPPQKAGTYAVTFDVEAVSGWNAASTLAAGNLAVTTGGANQTPVAGDYTFAGLSQTAESVTAVIITAKEGKSSGARTVHYQGIGITTYTKSTTIPQIAGVFTVTFDVAAAAGWNAAAGLSAGNLIVYPATANDRTPAASDYNIEKLGQTAGSVTAVAITAKSSGSYSPGAIRNIQYDGNAAIPQTAGTYAVTFDVDAAAGWKMATGLSAGNLTVNAVGDTSQTPVSGDYDIVIVDYTTAGTGNITPVNITPRTGKSSGARTIYYEGIEGTTYARSTTLPQAAGTYAVTFDVAAPDASWKAAAGLFAGNLVVTPAVNSPSTPGLAFELINDGTAYRVSKGTVTRGAVVIPATYEGKFVMEIGGASDDYTGAFRYTNITGVTIPPTIMIIGNEAFSDCASLTGVTIPASVTTIGTGAFSGCASLTGVTIPASVTTIGDRAFQGCANLTGITVDAANSKYTSDGGILYNKVKTTLIQAPGAKSGAVSIPGGVTTIGDQAFYDCSNLTGITISSSVTTIGNWAFTNCTSLTGVTIPASVTTIGTEAFSECSRLTEINVNTGNLNYASIDGVLYNKAKTDLIQVPTAISGAVSIPEGATSIGWAFSGCSRLTGLTIPASITKIENGAFSGCTSLTGISVDESNPNYASVDGVLYNKAKTLLIHVPRAISGAVSIPEGVTAIGNSVFSYCTSLTSVTIPESVTAVGNYAFRSWTASQTIYVKGYDSEAAATAAWSGNWRRENNAVIKYWNGSEWD